MRAGGRTDHWEPARNALADSLSVEIRRRGRAVRTRLVISLAAACLVVLATLGPFPASRAAVPPPALDLAAMALQPPDLPAGYGFLSSQIITVGTQAQAINEARGGNAAGEARLVYQLTSDGWQRGQQIFFGLPRQGDPTQAATAIGTALVEYADARGATAGFALTENATGIKNVATRPTSHTVGNESLITVDRRLANDPKQPQVWIDLTFRVDNLVATVAIINYSKTTPQIAKLEPLATKLQQRIAAVRSGKGVPGLSTRAVRLGGANVASFYDHYERLGGKTFPYLGESASDLAAQDKSYQSAGMSDVYYVYQAIGQTDRPNYVLYQLYIEHFAQEQDAKAWLRDTPGAYIANPTQGGTASLVPGAPTVGDGSAMVSYRYPRQDKTTASGYVVFLRVGQIGATVQLDGVPNVPRAAVERLAGDEAACLTKGGCLQPVAPPAGLHVQQPAATPAAATPAPTQATPAAAATAAATATIPPLVLPGATATARPGASAPPAEAVYRGNAAH